MPLLYDFQAHVSVQKSLITFNLTGKISQEVYIFNRSLSSEVHNCYSLLINGNTLLEIPRNSLLPQTLCYWKVNLFYVRIEKEHRMREHYWCI